MSEFHGEIDFSRGIVGSLNSWAKVSFHKLRDSLRIAVNGALFNRDELVALLSLTSVGDVNDSDILLAAYEKWSEDCAERLVGEFAFVVWDPRRRRVFCCRDQMAARQLYYWYDGSRFIFGSDPESILQTPGIPRTLNRRKLAAAGILRGVQYFPDESYYSGIAVLTAGSSITATASGLSKRIYWQPRVIHGLVPADESEAFEALRGLLFQAVNDRMAGLTSVGALLSGGLDSSAVVSVASKCMVGRDGVVTAMAGVLPENPSRKYPDEREYVSEFESWPNVRVEYVTPPDHAGPFDWIHEPSRFFRSFEISARSYLYEAFQQRAVSCSLSLILDGVVGELGPSNYGHLYFLELALRCKWDTLRKQLIALKEREGRSPLRELASNLLNVLAPLRGKTPLVLLEPAFLSQFERPPRVPRSWPDQRNDQAADIRFYLASRPVSPAFQVPHSYPLIDKRIVDFCLSAPGNLKVGEGYRRLAIRKALDGILPPKIQWRTDKMPFSPDYFARYNAQLDKAKAFVSAIGPNDPVRMVVDVDQLRNRLIPHGPGVIRQNAGRMVPSTIYLICFLRQFSEFRV